MGSLIKVESSAYTKDVIDIYSSNKVGQYSKYLSLTPEFVTYYSVNQIMSRTDVGTGSVITERGYNSPLRFNKIKNLPVYNLPVLSPDITFDESGIDIDMDVNDVVLLPDTVKPTVPDYMIYTLPEGRQILFRVHTFRYNTIQSNEFVNISLELKDIGEDLEAKMEPQVVKTYYTVFENIGTEDKCFIEEEAVETVNGLVDAITECSDIYQNMYWDDCVGGYVLSSNYQVNKVIYDVFLTYFINNTDLFPHRDTSLTTLPYLDYVPPGSEALYKRSMLYAVEHKTNKLLARDLFYFLGLIKSPFSPFKVYHYDAQSVNLQLLAGTVSGQDLKPYYDRVLTQVLILGQAEYPIWPPVEDDTDEEVNDNENSENENDGDQTQEGTEEINPPGNEDSGTPDTDVPSGTESEGSEDEEKGDDNDGEEGDEGTIPETPGNENEEQTPDESETEPEPPITDNTEDENSGTSEGTGENPEGVTPPTSDDEVEPYESDSDEENADNEGSEEDDSDEDTKGDEDSDGEEGDEGTIPETPGNENEEQTPDESEPDPEPPITDDSDEDNKDDTGSDDDEDTPTLPDSSEEIPIPPSVKPSVIVPADRIYDEFESAPIKKPTELILTNEDKKQIMLYSDDQKYIFNLIIQYMLNTTTQVNFDAIIQILMTKGRFSYFYGPIIIYILRKTYDSYFTKSTSETD